jgi:uncharacterized protein YjiS (DUF1127 family)
MCESSILQLEHPFVRATNIRPRATGLFDAASNWLHHLATYVSRSRQRRALSDLDGYLLVDIGVTRDAAIRESGKPFWQ